MKLGLVLLTKNEIDGVTALVDKIPFRQVDEVICVDGASSDGTAEFLRSKGLRVIAQANRGRGDAFHCAWRNTTADALIFFSPDGNEDPADIPRFKPLLEQGFDMVIASRMMKGARNEEDDQLWRIRKWANNGFNLAANVLWNRQAFVTDTINGFRALTRKTWALLDPTETGFSIEYQLSIRAMKAGLRIAEFPTYESARIGGESSAKSLPTGIVFLKLLARELAAGRSR